jgi:hypothetical protein
LVIIISSTRIEGEIQSIFEMAVDHILDKRLMSPNMEIKLIANDKELEKRSSGVKTDMDGMRFHRQFAL